MLGSVRFRIAAALFSLLALFLIASATAPLWIAIAITAFAATGLAFLLTRMFVTPLDRITVSARRIAEGNLGERVSPRPSGELGELADAFNQMGRSLEEQIAAASHDRTRMLAALNSSADAVVALDDQDRVKFANVAAERLLLRPENDMIGTLFSWMMPDQSFLDALRASREDANRQSLVIERANRRYLQAIVAPIIGGGDWATLIVFHDVTDTRRLEQVRRDFVANVSHELRTPLAALKSVIETLHAGAVDDPATARDFLSRAEDEMDRLVLMVEELLQLSRIESGELPLALGSLDMRDVLTNAVDRMKTQADRKGVSLTLDLTQATPLVVADRELLERAVVNLIHNAVKFTAEGGSIDVCTRPEDGGVAVEVRDSGEGIDPVDLPRVFERFYKADRARRAGGTGLGLAIVKHTIEAHGGSVKADSEPGRGSTFRFSIPVKA